MTAYDLSHAEQLLNESRYAEAASELKTAIEWLQTTGQRDVLIQAQALLERSESGQRALGLATEARAALEQFDYVRAQGLIDQARQAYSTIGDTTQSAVLDAYAARAARGQQASQMLIEARGLAGGLRYLEARDAADRATAAFVALGDEQQIAEARALRAALDQRQSLLGGLLLALGCGGLIASFWRRFSVREAEAW